MSRIRHDESSRKLVDQVVGSSDLGDPVALLTTTYDFDPDFFELDYLPSLLRLPAGDDRSYKSRIQLEGELARMSSVAVLVEARRFQGRPRSLRVHVKPAGRAGHGVLHAKVTLVVHPEAVRLVVGSANLTSSGYRANREVAIVLIANRKRTEECRLVRQALAGMDTLLAPWWSDAAEVALNEARQRLEEWATSEDVEDGAVTRFAWGGAELPLWRQFADAWPRGEKVRQVTIVSPFWSDAGPTCPIARLLAALREREARTEGARVRLVTAASPDAQHTHVPTLPDSYRTFDFRTLGVTATAVAAKALVDAEDLGRDDILRERSLHAKIVIIEGPAWTLAYVGSANFTLPGWGFLDPAHSNLEAGILLRRKGRAGDDLHALVPPCEGEPQPLEGGGTAVLAGLASEPEGTAWPWFVRAAELRRAEGEARAVELCVTLSDASRPTSWSLALDPNQPARLTEVDMPSVGSKCLSLAPDEVRTVFRNQAVYVRWDGMAGDQPVAYPINVAADLRESLPFGDPEALPREGDLIAFYQGRLALEDAFPSPPDADDPVGSAGAGNDSEVDTSKILSYQVRNFVEALPGIRDELQRNTTTESAMRLALLGPISPLALAREIGKAAASGRSAVAVGFQLTELLVCVRSCHDHRVDDKLVDAWMRALDEAEREIREVLDRVQRGHPELVAHGAFRRYSDDVLRVAALHRNAEVTR